MGAIAAAHQKDVLHRAAFHGVDDSLRVGQYRRVAEAGGQHVAAIDAAHAVIVVVAAQLQRLPDERREVLAAVFIGGDVGQAVVTHHGGGVDAVGVAGARRHQAVGGEQHGGGDGIELRLLALPRCAEVARQVGVGFQLGITVGGQHLTMGVNVDAFTPCLLQKLVQILQIVAGDYDERAFFDVRVHPRGYGIAEGAGVGAVQQSHAPEVHLAELHDEGQPLLHGVRPVDGAQALVEPVRHRRVPAAQVQGVMGVGGHALHAEQQGGAQRDDVRLALPQVDHRCLAAAQTVALRRDAVGEAADGVVIEVDVGQRGEQTVYQQAGRLRRVLPAALRRLRKADELGDELILQMGGGGLLAAHAGADAALVAGSLLALETKHV